MEGLYVVKLRGVLGEAAVDAEKSKAVGVVFNGRMKKRGTKLPKVGSRLPWARLISQYSQVYFFNTHWIYGLFGSF